MLGMLPPPSSPDKNWLAAESGFCMKSCTGRQVTGGQVRLGFIAVRIS